MQRKPLVTNEREIGLLWRRMTARAAEQLIFRTDETTTFENVCGLAQSCTNAPAAGARVSAPANAETVTAKAAKAERIAERQRNAKAP